MQRGVEQTPLESLVLAIAEVFTEAIRWIFPKCTHLLLLCEERKKFMRFSNEAFLYVDCPKQLIPKFAFFHMISTYAELTTKLKTYRPFEQKSFIS